MRQGPLAGRYPAVAAMVLLALIPYLALSAALTPLTPIIGEQLHAGTQALALSSGLSNAAYAVGTVLAVQLAQLLPQRRVMIVYVILLVLASIVTASAQSIVMFDIGRIVQGLCTSLLLIAAVPPLALGYPVNKLKTTAVILSMLPPTVPMRRDAMPRTSSKSWMTPTSVAFALRRMRPCVSLKRS